MHKWAVHDASTQAKSMGCKAGAFANTQRYPHKQMQGGTQLHTGCHATAAARERYTKRELALRDPDEVPV